MKKDNNNNKNNNNNSICMSPSGQRIDHIPSPKCQENEGFHCYGCLFPST